MLVKERKGRYYIQFYSPERGRTVMFSTGLTVNKNNLITARKLLAEFKQVKQNNRWNSIFGVNLAKRKTFSEAFYEFKNENLTNLGRKRSDASIRAYDTSATLWIQSCGDKLINLYTKSDGKKFINFLRNSFNSKLKQQVPFSENTIANYSRHMFALFNHFRQNELCKENPVIKVPAVKIAPKSMLIEDRNKMLDYLATNNIKLFKFVIFILTTGLRKGDAVNLRWEQVDFNRKIITLPEPKGNVPAYLPLSETSIEILKTITITDMNDRVFGYTYDSIRIYEKEIKKMNLSEHYTLHQLRKTFTSSLLNNNISLLKVSRLIDHKDTETTANHYFESDIKSLKNDLDYVLNRDDYLQTVLSRIDPKKSQSKKIK